MIKTSNQQVPGGPQPGFESLQVRHQNRGVSAGYSPTVFNPISPLSFLFRRADNWTPICKHLLVKFI